MPEKFKGFSLSHAINIVLGIVLGVCAEFVAYKFKLWSYRKRRYLIRNILFVFGVLLGTITYSLSLTTSSFVFFIFALIYEFLNTFRFLWWRYPRGNFLGIQNDYGVILALALLWGTCPSVIYFLNKLLVF